MSAREVAHRSSGEAAIPPTLVFVGGLHRSGTSLVHRCLASHPAVSGFSGTGVPEDEGQHLQTVYLQDFRLGGAGVFAFEREAQLTEASPLATAQNRARLIAEWGPHWRPGAAVGVEKSPPNLVRMRFLQALFPSAVFVVVLRHPVAVAGATRKGRRRLLSYERLVHHWVACHAIAAGDAPRIRNLLIVRYEHLVADPGAALGPVFAAVSLTPPSLTGLVQPGRSDEYFNRWHPRLHARTIRRWEADINRFGYSLLDLSQADPAVLPSPQNPTPHRGFAPGAPLGSDMAISRGMSIDAATERQLAIRGRPGIHRRPPTTEPADVATAGPRAGGAEAPA
jgi:Sulfotransferase family